MHSHINHIQHGLSADSKSTFTQSASGTVAYTMVSVDEIFHRIAQDLRGYSDEDPGAAAEEFLLGSVFDLHVNITANTEDTRKSLISRYGKGHSYTFPLKDYEHGMRLASQMYWILLGTTPEMETRSTDKFSNTDPLFLFVHLRDVIPAPIKRSGD
jgi:hypothetical protein